MTRPLRAAAFFGAAIAVAASGFVVVGPDRVKRLFTGEDGAASAPSPASSKASDEEPRPTLATLAASTSPATAPASSGDGTLRDVERAMRQARYEAVVAYLKANPNAADAEEARKSAMDLARELGHWEAVGEHAEAFLAAFPASADALSVRLSRASALGSLDKMEAAKRAYKEGLSLLKVGEDSAREICNAYQSYASFLVEMGDVEGAKKTLDDLVTLYKDDSHLGPQVKRLAEMTTAPLALLGHEPPALTEVLRDMDGKEIRYEDFKGKVLLIDFWATWCAPCREEMPHLVAAHRQWHEKGFEILGVAVDREGAEKAIQDSSARVGMTWRQYYDGGHWRNKLAELYGVKALPANFLVGKDGKVVRYGLRGAALDRALAKLLE